MSMSSEQIQKADANEIYSTQWSCSICTFMNIGNTNSCQMCGMTNAKSITTQHINEIESENYCNNEQCNKYVDENYDNYNENEYYDDEYYEDDTYDGAEYCDYDEVDWDAAKKRLTKTTLTAKKSKRKKKKKKVVPNINSLNSSIPISNSNNIVTDAKQNENDDENGDNIPGLKMIYDEKKDSVERILIKKFDHPLRIRVMMVLNYDGYTNYDYKAWKLNITGNTSYKKCHYLLSSCRIDVFDKFTNKYWDSVTFLPCKRSLNTRYRLDIVNNASIPVFVKIKNTKYVEMGKRGIVRDIDTCILYYIAQYCLETRFRNIGDIGEYKKNADEVFIPDMIKNGIKWNIKRNVRKSDIDCKSPVYHRKLWKLFDKYIPNIHMLFHVIFQYLGYDRITNIIIEGNTMLNNITDTCFNRIAYGNQCIPTKKGDNNNNIFNKVYENNIEYDIDESILKMDNKQMVKHHMNVAIILNKENYGYSLQRHEPFKNKYYNQDSIWIPEQNPMNNILKKANKLKTITLTGL